MGKKDDIADGVELELDSTGEGAALCVLAVRHDFRKFSKLCNRGSKNLNRGEGRGEKGKKGEGKRIRDEKRIIEERGEDKGNEEKRIEEESR